MLFLLSLAQAVAAPADPQAASAQPPPVAMSAQPGCCAANPAQPPPAWDPAAAYISLGQDEPGYRNWFAATPLHPIQVKAFNEYLTQWGVGGVVPTWKLIRTATSWSRCGAQPFEVPPLAEWPRIVQTLRYIHDYVVPAVGPVEPVSAYRNPVLNQCAGGAPESAHMQYSAVDLVPLKPITREKLMHDLCAVHGRRGTDYDVGLGFYAYLRFHVDTTRFRRWGADPAVASCPPIVRPVDVATVAQPAPAPVAIPSSGTATLPSTAPATAQMPTGQQPALSPSEPVHGPPAPQPPPSGTPQR